MSLPVILQDATAIVAGCVAFGVTSLLMPHVVRYARRRHMVDLPDGIRRVHGRIVPRAGGVAILFGLFGAVVTTAIAVTGIRTWGDGSLATIAGPDQVLILLSILGGMMVAALIGFVDDFRPVSASVKLLAQILAAVPLVSNDEWTGPLAVLTGWGPGASGLFVVAWVVFMTNAFNLLDGLDGLAAGVTVIGASFLIVLGSMVGAPLIMTVGLVGAMLAFLRFNLPPARVFMGDTGSLVAGYLLGVASLSALASAPTPSRALAILVAVGLPSLDLLAAVVRRLATGRSPFSPDADHLHHRLVRRSGGQHGRSVFTMYLAAVLLGLFALLVDRLPLAGAAILTAAVAVLGAVICWDLGYFDRSTYRTQPQVPGVQVAPRTVSRRAPSRVATREPAAARMLP